MKTVLILAGGGFLISIFLSSLGVDHLAWHILAGVLWGGFGQLLSRRSKRQKISNKLRPKSNGLTE